MESGSRKRSLSPYSGRAAQSSTKKPLSQSESRKPASGFKWKEKPKRDVDETRNEPKGLERGYRDQEKPKRREPEAGTDPIKAKFGNSVSDKFGAGASEKVVDVEGKGDGIAEKFGPGGDGKVGVDEGKKEEKKKRKKEKTAAGPRPTAEEMIIVNINDRLGTKAAIPCLASDPIKLFKAQVAARIGREPHEIMLKRQGERPFKDQLTLQDYGVSNGVQLDLEVDTGD